MRPNINKNNINFESIPAELKQIEQWVGWKKEIREGKETKIPCIPANTGFVKVDITNRANFRACDFIYSGAVKGLYDGIGFVFTEGDPYCFIDLDKRIDEQGEIDPQAKEIIDRLNSYTEISQSGRGIHIIVKAKLPSWAGNRKGKFEIYDKNRYLCITGNVLSGYPAVIEDRQKEIEKLCKEIFDPAIKEPAKTQNNYPKKMSNHYNHSNQQKMSYRLLDQEIIERARNATNGDKFNSLWSGQWEGNYPSQSEAELALAGLIAFWTQDQDQIERIMRGSGLVRDKWDKHKSYLRNTIQKAMSNGDHYQGIHKAELKKIMNTRELNVVSEHDISRFFDGRQFIPARLAEELMSKHKFIFISGVGLYVYIGGVYKPIGVDFIKQECCKVLGEATRINYINEVVSYIQYSNLIDSEELNKHKDLINLKNGMYDIGAENLLDHSEEYLSTIQIPVEYDPSADNTEITEWLESTLGDPACIQLATELFGYCLIPDTTMAKAFMLVGSGANGKSTFLTVLENFIGKDNVSKIPLQELADHRFKRAELYGKLVNVFADLDSRALESTTYFKTIITGDSIDAERKNQNPFSFRPFARLVFSANEIPRARDRSFAYYRRWCIIPFEQVFTGRDEKKGLAEKLCEPKNLSALLNCALDGLKKIRERQGFTEPERVKNALSEYEKQNDPVKAFVDDCCKFDPNARTERTELYTHFCKYCEDAGFHITTRNSFYQRIRMFREITEITDQKGKRVFCGIEFAEE